MNRGLLEKSIRETAAVTLVFAAGAAVVEGFLSFAIPTFFSEYSEALLRMELVQRVVGAIVGTEGSRTFGPDALRALPWVHPVILALTWAHAIWFGTRMPVAEIDRGTIDVLLALPASRRSVLAHDGVVWLGSGLVVIGAVVMGNLFGRGILRGEGLTGMGAVLMTAANLYAVYLVVGGVTFVASSGSDRRGRAVGVAFSIALFWYFLNFLSQFWAPAKPFRFMSVINYYRPLQIAMSGDVPWENVAVLVGAAAVFVCGAAVVFERRDIRVG